MLYGVQAAAPTQCPDPSPRRDSIGAQFRRAAGASVRSKKARPWRAEVAAARYPKTRKQWVPSPGDSAADRYLRFATQRRCAPAQKLAEVEARRGEEPGQ